MNPPPSSPDSEYQNSWENEEMRQVFPNSLPKLAERLNEEIANNPDLSARCINSAGQEPNLDGTQAAHANSLDAIPEEDTEHEAECPKAEDEVEPLATTENEAPSHTADAQQHNQENLPPMRRRFYSTSDTESPEPLLAPPSSPVAKHPYHSSYTNGTK